MTTQQDQLKAIANERGCSLKSLTVLAPQNDPFRIGTPYQFRQAEWFAAVLENARSPEIHLREIHYSLVGSGTGEFYDGEPYFNDQASWERLQKYAKFARVLGLVDTRRLVDKRTPDPHLYAPGRIAEPYLQVDEGYLRLPEIASSISRGHYSSGGAELHEMRYQQADQPYHVEVWAEKSSVEEELRPLCARFGVNLMLNKGFSSYTTSMGIIDRCIASGKPARVLCVSDFDPAGDDMPTALARYLEFNKEEYAGLDICLEPVLMTAEIALEYGLPRSPIKTAQGQRDRFQAFHGEGGVELEALKVLHPGATAAIMEKAIWKYRDSELRGRINDVAESAATGLSASFQDATAPLQDEWQAISQDADAIADRYHNRLRLLSDRMNREMEPIQERADELMLATDTITSAFEYEIPDRPASELEVNLDHYFDSRREYLDQLPYHKRRKGQ